MVEVNPAVEEMLGYQRRRSSSGVSFRNFMHRDDVERSVARFDDMMAGARDSYAVRGRYNRKDGSVDVGAEHGRRSSATPSGNRASCSR